MGFAASMVAHAPHPGIRVGCPPPAWTRPIGVRHSTRRAQVRGRGYFETHATFTGLRRRRSPLACSLG
jgi:hypothetical protein